MKPLIPRIMVAASLLFAVAARAEDAPKAEGYRLENRSSFDCVETQRAPFWPIGWVKRVKGGIAQSEAPAVPKFTFDPKSFKVTSILLGPPALAVINGRPYGEGEVLKQPRGAAGTSLPQLPSAVRIRVQRITDGQVILQCEDQMLTALVQRTELSGKKDERELLLDDR